MAGRYRNVNRSAYRSAGYAQNSRENSYDRGYSSRNNRPPKHSGCSSRMLDDGSIILWGWRLVDGAMVKMYARPYKKSQLRTSKTGKDWVNLFVTLTNTKTMQVTKTGGLVNMANHKLYINELNLVANPKAPNGGYFGKHISKTYNR